MTKKNDGEVDGPTVGAAASDATKASIDAARKVAGVGKVAARASARKVVQTGKQAASLGRKVAISGARRSRLAGKKPEEPKLIVLHEVPETTKVGYLQLLVWLTFQDDDSIDDRELSELHLLMVQIGCNPESRQAVRNAIEEPAHLAADEIVASLREQTTEKEQWTAIACSLLMDATRLDRSLSIEAGVAVTLGADVPGRRRHERGVRRLANLLDVTDEEMNFIERACDLERKILSGQIASGQVAKYAKELASTAGGLGGPIAAIYLSGSVTGLSAAGISSGLAAIGFGGLLGLSAMMSGLGIAIVGGAVIYRGTRWFMDRGSRASSSLREKKLQQILRIHQKAIANLAEDIGYLGDRLVRSTVDVKINRARIEKLAKEMTLFRGALKKLQDTDRSLEDQIARERTKTEAADAVQEDAAASSSDEPEPTI